MAWHWSPERAERRPEPGSLTALLQLRDEVAPTFQSQLDEIAKGLVSIFSETNTAGTSTLPGLFTWTQPDGTAGGTPTTGAIINGIAAPSRSILLSLHLSAAIR